MWRTHFPAAAIAAAIAVDDLFSWSPAAAANETETEGKDGCCLRARAARATLAQTILLHCAEMISWPASATTAKNKSPWFTLALDPLLLLICWSYQLPSWRRRRASSWIALITQFAAFLPSVFLRSSQLSLSFSSSAAATTEQRGQLVRLYYVIAKYRNSGCFLPIETISFLLSAEILAQKKKTAVKREIEGI